MAIEVEPIVNTPSAVTVKIEKLFHFINFDLLATKAVSVPAEKMAAQLPLALAGTSP